MHLKGTSDSSNVSISNEPDLFSSYRLCMHCITYIGPYMQLYTHTYSAAFSARAWEKHVIQRMSHAVKVEVGSTLVNKLKQAPEALPPLSVRWPIAQVRCKQIPQSRNRGSGFLTECLWTSMWLCWITDMEQCL